MTPADMASVVLVGAVVGFDTVSFPQAMLSRPIVASTLGGAIAGNASLGLLCGAILECFALETLPVGASRYPEWGSASLVGGALYADTPSGSTGALVMSVIIGLSGAWLGGWSMIRLRTLNAQRARRNHDAVASGDPRVILGLQLSGLAADLLRGATLTALLLAISLPLRDIAARGWTQSPDSTRLTLGIASVAVAASAVWKHFSSVPNARIIMLAAAMVSGLLVFFT
ncbi:MAG TPA: PTS sugar transporter subunit IIC [Gemmatimonadaceae bacterium]|nr:PTS sugar transporter subunit IIC [Gemmatimonadaceae bacterium]